MTVRFQTERQGQLICPLFVNKTSNEQNSIEMIFGSICVIIKLTITMEVVCTKVGLAYNLPRGTRPEIEDWEAEYDSMEVVMDIKRSIESDGHEVVLMEAVPEKVYSYPHI